MYSTSSEIDARVEQLRLELEAAGHDVVATTGPFGHGLLALIYCKRCRNHIHIYSASETRYGTMDKDCCPHTQRTMFWKTEL